MPWWSVGKTAIAAAALTLVDDGVLALDRPVEDAPYSLRQLLQHSAGLTDYGTLPAYQEAVARKDEPWPVSELLRRTEAARLRYPPGGGWQYSNIGYLEVRRLLEQITGAALDDILRSRIFAPLGIRRAGIAAMREDLAGIEMGTAAGYHPGWVYHGLIVGPLQEAALLIDGLLGGRLLAPPLLREMMRPRPVSEPLPGRPWRAPAYGLGVMLDAPGDCIAVAGHTGGGPASIIAVYRSGAPERPRTVAAFQHGDEPGPVEHAAFAHDDASA